MEIAWWLLGALVLAVAIAAAFRQNKAVAQATAAKEAAAAAARTHTTKPSAAVISIATSMSLREHKPDSYRFDGSAYPQFSISYADVNGSLSEREIYVDTWHRCSTDGVIYFTCWCFSADDQRTFRSDRIRRTVNLSTNRSIKSIADYMER